MPLQLLGTFCGWSVLLVMWLMGRKTVWGPICGVIFQVTWCIYAAMLGNIGLLAAAFTLGLIHIWNWIKWSKQEKHNAEKRKLARALLPDVQSAIRKQLPDRKRPLRRHRVSDRGKRIVEPRHPNPTARPSQTQRSKKRGGDR